MLAANTGDKDAFAFYINGSTDKSFLDDLRNKLRNSEEQIKALNLEIEASKEATSQLRELEEAIVSERRLQQQVDELTVKLSKLETMLGGRTEEPIKGLMATVHARDEMIQVLEQKVKAHEAVQAPLLSELHTVASAWGQLEEATSRKVIDLAQKEDLIYKLLSDKTRQESKCNLLIRAKDASANMTAVMKRQSDLQLDQIRKLEEREKNLNMQMVSARDHGKHALMHTLGFEVMFRSLMTCSPPPSSLLLGYTGKRAGTFEYQCDIAQEQTTRVRTAKLWFQGKVYSAGRATQRAAGHAEGPDRGV